MNLTDLIDGEYFEEVQEMLANPKHPSIYENYGNFQFFIVRRMEIERTQLKRV